ncbi:chaperone protein ClpB [Striga asiatica]|uniref:Chaperone protein ClpB n=1 Tax=Striga asiatica TaxID=4170 RepID=A0A5A7QEE9_STRAF|nr:chaperone protein ClpB [Striga asiatica]
MNCDKTVPTSIKLAAVGDHHRPRGPAAPRPGLLHHFHDVVPFHHLPEHHVLAVEPLRLPRADEELRAVGPRPGVRHRQDPRPGVLPHEVLVGELGAVDRLAADAVSRREIAALAHEIGDHAVEGRPLVMEGLAGFSDALLAGAQGAEVLGCLRDHVCEELHHDPPGGMATDRHKTNIGEIHSDLNI